MAPTSKRTGAGTSHPARPAIDYRRDLEQLEDWDAYLREHSRLPGPRGNLELLAVVAETGTSEQFARWASLDVDEAPSNTPREFVVACGVVGHGRLAAEGKPLDLALLQHWANDPRWRVREATAMCLQRLGDDNPTALVRLARALAGARASALERRAAVAALCEPRLLVHDRVLDAAIGVLQSATDWLRARPVDQRRDPDVRTLRQALGYAWSVAVAADPGAGVPRFERLCEDRDPDVGWIARQNLRKARLGRAAPTLVDRYT